MKRSYSLRDFYDRTGAKLRVEELSPEVARRAGSPGRRVRVHLLGTEASADYELVDGRVLYCGGRGFTREWGPARQAYARAREALLGLAEEKSA